ncbi:hypothetical protein COOONC_18430 [Cooperia oncophora]
MGPVTQLRSWRNHLATIFSRNMIFICSLMKRVFMKLLMSKDHTKWKSLQMFLKICESLQIRIIAGRKKMML